MKQNLIYIILACFVFSFTACEDDVLDATSKHEYGEDEYPYLRVDADATVTTDLEFSKGFIEEQSINLEDYAEVFQTKLNMTVDQVLSGLDDGSIVFDNISIARNVWTKSAKSLNSAGWYFNSAGTPCAADDAEQTASLELDKANKKLIVNMNDDVRAGVTLAINVGFAVNGVDYDEYVRFSFNLSVVDPTVILVSANIPEGDYSSVALNFNDYAENISITMGLTVEEFLANLEYNGDTGEATDGTIKMFVVNNETEEWDETSDYTGEKPGYWMNDKGEVCSWGDEGYSLFANTKNADQVVYVGRAPELEAGTAFTISFGYRDTVNPEHYFRFIITATLE